MGLPIGEHSHVAALVVVIHGDFACQRFEAEVKDREWIVISSIMISGVHIGGDKIEGQTPRAVPEGNGKHFPHVVLAVWDFVVKDFVEQRIVEHSVDAIDANIPALKAGLRILLGGVRYRLWNNIDPGIINRAESVRQY